jgi:hypothetical protein
MSLPDKPSLRKPSRLGLYMPFAVLLAAVAAWSFGWSWMRGAVFREMDKAAGDLGAAGYQVDWTGRTLSGFPFRLDIDIAGPRLREVSGWGLSAPRLKAEAFVFAPDHWVIVAPEGFTLQRRRGGPVRIGAGVLRASLSDASAHPPRLSVEGRDLTFSAGAGGAPVSMTEAKELHLHAKAGPDDQGALYLEIDRARTSGSGPLAQMAGAEPLTLIAAGVFSHASGLNGVGLAGALRAWAAAGGELRLRQFSLDAGAVSATAASGSLGVDGYGRLKGGLDLRLKQGPRLLGALLRRPSTPAEAIGAVQAVLAASRQGGTETLGMDFQAGRTTIGPVAVGPAPRVY